MVTVAGGLQAADLVVGRDYVGRAPGDEHPVLWTYVERRELKKEAPRYMFLDARVPCAVEKPDMVGFTASEVSEHLVEL